MFALAALAAGMTACSIPTKMFTGGGGGGGDASAGDGAGSGDGRTPDAGMIDGPAGPFACLGQPFPTTTNAALVTISGKVTSANGSTMSGVQVQVLRSDGTIAQSTQTDGSASFTVTLQTGGAAQDVSLLLMDPFGLDERTYYYPSRPLTSDLLNLQLELYDQQTLQQMYSVGGVPFINGNSTMFAEIVDCNGAPVANATVQEVQGPANRGVRYLRNNSIDASALSTDSTGTAIVFGQPMGQAVYSAQMSAGMAHSYAYNIMTQAVLFVAIQP